MKKKKVLIVDDQLDNLISGMEAAKDLQFEPLGASSLKDAIEIIKKEDLYLVLTDMAMEGNKDAGIEIVKACYKKGIPVGVVTMRRVIRLFIPEGLSSDSLELIKIETIGEEEKDVNVWKKAFQRLEKEVNLEEGLATQKKTL